MDFWTSLEGVRTRNDVLRHPFYERWSAGELTQPELATYAGQYRHAVVALARACANAAESVDAENCPELRAELDGHAFEEAEHIALWDGFCASVGGDRAAAATPETSACASAWAGEPGRPLLHTLVALHAIEGAQPAISRAKLSGLVEHYALDEQQATAYFELHAQRDVEHAAASQRIISQRLFSHDGERGPSEHELSAMLEEADAVLAANWLLLDGVERIASAEPR
jgi:pyrroloquinoline-quinone synthase